MTIVTRNGAPSGFTRTNAELLWLYMRRSDLAGFDANVAAFNRLAGKVRHSKIGPMWKRTIARELQIIDFYAQGNWSEDFIVVSAERRSEGCEAAHWRIVFYPRSLVLEVVVIENASDQEIEIGELLGDRSSQRTLRPISGSLQQSGQARTPIGAGPVRLGPKARIVVPVRILLVPGGGLANTFAKATGSKPAIRSYIWGPELALKALTINGENHQLAGASANFLSLTTSCECGSCPYHYALDQTTGRWRSHGKVIHVANSKALETTDRVSLERFVSRFRLAELEAEVAMIDEVVQVVGLRNGRELRLRPLGQQAMAISRRDGKYASIYWGDALDFGFRLPPGIKPQDVSEAAIEVTGYYIR